MALLPNTPFTDGQDWTAAYANQAFAQVFDDQTQYLGHQARLTDDSLSNAAGNIKDRLAAIEAPLKVSVASGLTLTYTAGSIRLPSGAVAALASGLIAVANNATSFVWVNASGVVETGLVPPAIRLLLARVVTVGGVVSSLEDSRSLTLRAVAPVAGSIKVFGGSNVADKTCTNNEAFDDGFYYYRDFIVPAGVSITVDKYAKIVCSGKIDIAGTITVSQATQGATGLSTGCVATLNLGGGSGTGIGAGSGSSGTGGSSNSYAVQPHGSGGGGGIMSGTGSGQFSKGGNGGGGLWLEASGTISVSGSIIAKGTNATIGVVLTGTLMLSGGGGGSGGLVYLASLISVTLTSTCSIDVRGGNGANGVNNTGSNRAVGGGGGGGGWLVIAAPVVNTTGSTVLLTGGSVGTDAGTGAAQGGGAGAGYGGAGGNGGSPGLTGKQTFLTFSPIG